MDVEMTEVNAKPIKHWENCSIKERRLIDLILQGVNYDKIASTGLYKKGTIYNKKAELNEAILERMAMLDSQRVLSLEQALSQVSDIATNLYDDKTADRLKALDMLIKNKGGYVEKVEIKQDEGIKIEIVPKRDLTSE